MLNLIQSEKPPHIHSSGFNPSCIALCSLSNFLVPPETLLPSFPRSPAHLHVLRQPAYGLSVSLSHHHGAHEQLDRSDTLELNLALASGLVKAELMSHVVLGDGVGVVDLVAQDNKGNLGELLHGEKSVKLDLGLLESLVVLGVDEEDDAVDLGEVISPDSASWGVNVSPLKVIISTSLIHTLLVTAQIEGGESNVTDGELLGCYQTQLASRHMRINRNHSAEYSLGWRVG